MEELLSRSRFDLFEKRREMMEGLEEEEGADLLRLVGVVLPCRANRAATGGAGFEDGCNE